MMVQLNIRKRHDNRGLRTFVASLLLISSALILASVPGAFALGYTVSVRTNSSSYSGSQTIRLTGSVSPAPGSGTSVLIDVWNPSGTLVHTDDVPVNGSTGAFNDSFVAGGTNWADRTYTVNATWALTLGGPTYYGTASFSYVTTTTTTTATTSRTSTTSTTSVPTTSTASTTVITITTATTTTTTEPTTITQSTTQTQTITQPTTSTQTQTQNRTVTQTTTRLATTTTTTTTTSLSTSVTSSLAFGAIGAAIIVALVIVAEVLKGRKR